MLIASLLLLDAVRIVVLAIGKHQSFSDILNKLKGARLAIPFGLCAG